MNRGRWLGVAGYWLASGLSLASVLVLAVLAGQALTLQEREEARRGRDRMMERVAAAASAFAKDVPGFLGGRAAVPIPVPIASLPPLVMPDDEEARAALLGSLASGEAGRLPLLEAHLNASGVGQLSWKWMLAQRGLASGNDGEAERWLREIAGVSGGEDRRLANGFPSRTAAALRLAGLLIRANRMAEAQVAIRSVIRRPRPEGPIGGIGDLLGFPHPVPASSAFRVPPQIEADLTVLREGWCGASEAHAEWYFSSRLLMHVTTDSNGMTLYFCDDLVPRLVAALQQASGLEGRERLCGRAGSGTVALTGLPGLFWDLTGFSDLDGAGDPAIGGGSRGRIQLGVAVAVALVGVSTLLLLGLRREQERRLSVSQEAFFAQAAHDLKTPLATLRVLSETLSLGRAASPEKQKKYLDQIIAEVDRSAETVDAMLMAGRLGAGTLEPRLEAVDPKQVFERLLERFGPRLEGWQVALAMSEPVVIQADPVMFERVGINLIENVLRHAAGGKVLDITLEAGRDGMVGVLVADRGSGSAGTGAAGTDGTAVDLFRAKSRLGLTLVDGIVRLHGGTWDRRERPGGGSMVEVRWLKENR